MIEVDPESIGYVKKESQKIKVKLNSNDEIFSSIRDDNLNMVLKKLHKYGNERKMMIKEIKSIENSISLLKDFIKNNLRPLNSLQESLILHFHFLFKLNELFKYSSDNKILEMEDKLLVTYNEQLKTVMDIIAKRSPILKVLRLICLHSICRDGLTPDQYSSYLSSIVTVIIFFFFLI